MACPPEEIDVCEPIKVGDKVRTGANLSDLLGVKKQEKRTVFFTMVMHPLKGWTRVGNAYPTRKLAGEWVPFVRGAWKGLRVKVSQCTVYLENGKVSEKSRRLLDTKYNLDA